jgi:hypothetical protein
MFGVFENLDGKVAVLLWYRVLMPTDVYKKKPISVISEV